jgi:hypothetical protein
LDDLIDYTNQIGVSVQVIPSGIELIPPSQNVERFGLSQDLFQAKQYLNSIFDDSTGDDADDDEKEEDNAVENEIGSSSAQQNYSTGDYWTVEGIKAEQKNASIWIGTSAWQ